MERVDFGMGGGEGQGKTLEPGNRKPERTANGTGANNWTARPRPLIPGPGPDTMRRL